MSRRAVDWFNVLRVLLLAAVSLWMVLAASRVFAADAQLSWQHPTQRTDNTPIALSEIRETQIDWAKCTAGNQFPLSVDGTKIVAAPANVTTIPNLAYGTWCFRARSVDTAGRVSDNSGTVWAQYLAPPKPPVLNTVGGLVWEMRLHPVDGPYLARVVGKVDAGVPCFGLAPQIGHDLFTVRVLDVDLNRKPNPNATLVAQCSILEG